MWVLMWDLKVLSFHFLDWVWCGVGPLVVGQPIPFEIYGQVCLLQCQNSGLEMDSSSLRMLPMDELLVFWF